MSVFLPLNQILRPAPPVRELEAVGLPGLPDGHYAFQDQYCIDPECDCRKTIIQVLHNHQVAVVLNYGWEQPEWYLNWLTDGGRNPAENDQELADGMSGVSIDTFSPDRVDCHKVLEQFNSMLDDAWIAEIKNNYRLVKEAVSRKIRQRRARDRRRPGTKGRRPPRGGGLFGL